MANSAPSVGAGVQDQPLSPELHPIEEAIRSSFCILDIEPDEDAGIIEPYNEATLHRAAEFLRKHASWLWKNHSVIIAAPRLEPGPNGSIDIHWNTSDYELLVNIRKDPSQRAGFYGDDRGKICIKGTLDPSAFNNGLAIWLMDKA